MTYLFIRCWSKKKAPFHQLRIGNIHIGDKKVLYGDYGVYHENEAITAERVAKAIKYLGFTKCRVMRHS